ncbi:cyclic nucleotide-binding domain-containing protein [Haliangium ochraceum]|uniref:cyclic nucleotide-binding domain-containing protein n=1 Tax=Haliangium ochraceum TaxID=80816 RepID=UPI00019B969E|nr:cyclic nucleotide-binding domain-containing protein [Haliangium ochraceum]
MGRTRSQNEDFFLIDDQLGFYIVCDGMGGHASGEVASELTASTIADELREHAALLQRYAFDPSLELRRRMREVLDGAVQRACREVWTQGSAQQGADAERGMGTTLSMLVVCGRFAFVVHVGDSRIYLVRGGAMHQLTEDHSLVNEMLKKGLIADDRVESYPFANFVTRAVGIQPEVEPDILHLELMNGDTFLLCSDGLTKHAKNSELLDVIHTNELDELPDVLVFMANEAGGEDNITAVVIGVGRDATTQTLQHTDLVARKIEMLVKLPLFSSFDYTEMVKLLEIIDTRSVAARDVIIREGESGDAMYIMLTGSAGVYKQEQLINELGPSDFFGELSLIDDTPRSATVVAREPSTLLIIERKRLFALLEKAPKMAARLYWSFLRRMSMQIRNKDNQLYQLRRAIESSGT